MRQVRCSCRAMSTCSKLPSPPQMCKCYHVMRPRPWGKLVQASADLRTCPG